MNIIIPLAGPDLFNEFGENKCLSILNGQPLLKIVLESRPWINNTADCKLVFVFQDETRCKEFFNETIREWYPNAQAVYLSEYTNGAAFSALAGLSILKDNAPVVIDLADIYYTCTVDVKKVFEDPCIDALITTFKSDLPIYSYVELDKDGIVQKAVEKKVISDHASSGTYIFRNINSYLYALNWLLGPGKKYYYNGSAYVCPILNAFAQVGQKVKNINVKNIIDIKIKK